MHVHSFDSEIPSKNKKWGEAELSPPHSFLVAHGIFLNLWVSSSDDDHGDQSGGGCTCYYEVEGWESAAEADAWVMH
jgi:hypothetical protein